jgi:hypothetical protein
MTIKELRKYLASKQLGAVLIVCPRCHKVDINPKTHADKCDPAGEAMRQENLNYYD